MRFLILPSAKTIIPTDLAQDFLCMARNVMSEECAYKKYVIDERRTMTQPDAKKTS